jgi:hypothetical protein
VSRSRSAAETSYGRDDVPDGRNGSAPHHARPPAVDPFRGHS